MDFTAKITDIYVYNINKYLGVSDDIDVNTNDKRARVDYSIEFECRNWGIKSTIIWVRKITFSLDWSVETALLSIEDALNLKNRNGVDMRNGDTEGTIDMEISKEWTIKEDDLKFSDDGTFQINDIEIDFEKNTITLN